MPLSPPPPLRWDLFCHVVDNLGDLGVCWRLAQQLAQRGQEVRLWVDHPAPLRWMAPGALEGRVSGVQVLDWPREQGVPPPSALAPSDVLIEAFGCEVPDAWVMALQPPAGSATDATDTRSPNRLWINLEYLSAEPYVERCHGLPSPVWRDGLAGRFKWFYYPGFTPATGGLLRETGLIEAIPPWSSPAGEQPPRVSLFCYEPPALAQALGLPGLEHAVWQVTTGRASAHMQAVLDQTPPGDASTAQRVRYLPAVTQRQFDELLWSSDLNFVRGEDSLVRALWAGRPLVWQLYPQHDGAHAHKLDAFLDWLDAPPTLRRFHRLWNGTEDGALPSPDLAEWGDCAQAARARLLQQADLVSQLIGFVQAKR